MDLPPGEIGKNDDVSLYGHKGSTPTDQEHWLLPGRNVPRELGQSVGIVELFEGEVTYDTEDRVIR